MKPKARKHFKRLSLILGAFAAIFTLSSCTKSFCSNLDKANQMYSAFGNIYQSQEKSNDVVDTNVKDNSVQKDDVEAQNKNRDALYKSLYGVSSTSYSYLPVHETFYTFMNNKVDEFVNNNYTYFYDGTIASFENDATETKEEKAKIICKHVAIYAGLDYNSENKPTGVSSTFKNLDNWYALSLADTNVIAPSANFINDFKSALSSATSSVTCITPESKTFNFNGAPLYIEGKSWGQAFKDYGFLEGLLVYPFSYIVHKISLSMGDSGWAQILAIFVVTILARLITVISTVIQARTTNKQQKLQPQLAQLAKKYPNSQTDPEEKRAMAMEQMKLFKQNKIHPFVPMLFMILQFPLFICVWSALQGSAALADGNWLGISLTTNVSQCFSNYASTPGALTGIFIFIFMITANILSSTTGLWLTSWRNKKFGDPNQMQQTANGGLDANKTMKYMTYGMLIFVVIMGFQLPAGMGIYWFIGAIISIIQSLIMEAVQTKNRHKMIKETGDGSELAFVRRSKHHQENQKEKSDSKSDKPLWRK